MARITVTHRHAFSFDVNIRGYGLVTAEPVTAGGTGDGPTPTELMVAGIAAAAAVEAIGKLTKLGRPYWPLEVAADFAWDRSGERIEEVTLAVALPGVIDPKTTQAVVEAISAGPGVRLLAEPPRIACRAAETRARVPATAGPSDWPPEPPPDVDSEDR